MDATMDITNRYLDEARIASGGMASVWKAYDRRLDRHVAIKRLHPHLLEDEQALARFGREIEIARRLDHPNIVSALDSGVDEFGPFLVMELIEGETLRQRIDGVGALPWTEVRNIVGQITEALQYAHGIGILHRDIKPANIMLENDSGRAVLVDFGIAVSDEYRSRLTNEGAAIGTVDYLAPERALGRPGTPTSDVYSLGAVTYETMTGKRAFSGNTPVEIALAHQGTIPAHPSLATDIPKAVGNVVMRALAKDPDNRYSSVAEFDMALYTAMQGTHELATVEFSLSRLRRWWHRRTHKHRRANGAVYAAIGSLTTYLVLWIGF